MLFVSFSAFSLFAKTFIDQSKETAVKNTNKYFLSFSLKRVKVYFKMEVIGNIWDNLTELEKNNPEKYEELIKESKKEYEKLHCAPMPHTCFYIQEVVTTYFYFK